MMSLSYTRIHSKDPDYKYLLFQPAKMIFQKMISVLSPSLFTYIIQWLPSLLALLWNERITKYVKPASNNAVKQILEGRHTNFKPIWIYTTQAFRNWIYYWLYRTWLSRPAPPTASHGQWSAFQRPLNPPSKLRSFDSNSYFKHKNHKPPRKKEWIYMDLWIKDDSDGLRNSGFMDLALFFGEVSGLSWSCRAGTGDLL